MFTEIFQQVVYITITFALPPILVAIYFYLRAKYQTIKLANATQHHYILEGAIESAQYTLQHLQLDFQAHKAAILANVQIFLDAHHIPLRADLVDQEIEAALRKAEADAATAKDTTNG